MGIHESDEAMFAQTEEVLAKSRDFSTERIFQVALTGVALIPGILALITGANPDFGSKIDALTLGVAALFGISFIVMLRATAQAMALRRDLRMLSERTGELAARARKIADNESAGG